MNMLNVCGGWGSMITFVSPIIIIIIIIIIVNLY